MNDLKEVRQIAATAKGNMKTILENDGFVLPADVVFEVDLKLKTAFGIDIEPSWRVRVDSHAECDGVAGYGDTIDAALAEFWSRLREKEACDRLPVFLKKQEYLECVKPYQSCQKFDGIGYAAGMDCCMNKAKGGEHEQL